MVAGRRGTVETMSSVSSEMTDKGKLVLTPLSGLVCRLLPWVW